MRTILIAVIFTFLFGTIKAQQLSKDTSKAILIDGPPEYPHVTLADTGKIFTYIEHMPEPKGGLQGFYKYLAKNIRYPAMARERKQQGNVFLSFVVERDGSISDIKVVRSVAPDLDAEAVRILKSSSKWTAGSQNGIALKVAYTMPITFRIP